MNSKQVMYAVYVLILGAIVFKVGMERSAMILMLAGAVSPFVAYRVGKGSSSSQGQALPSKQ